jgi:phosphatidylethanolamine/phosphatidyl-N-methylethanolamine N-methyltransferase
LRLQTQRPERGRPDKFMPFEERIADEARFIKAWLDNPIVTGAVSPSGRFLAQMMARYVDPGRPGPIVELGPGTGPITEAWVARGIAPERLVLVEYDAAFCALLARRFPAATIVKGDAYRLAETLADVLREPAAAIVSGVPLLNKPERQRIDLLKQAFALMPPDGSFVQFTYGMVSPIPRGKLRSGRTFFEAEASPAVWLNLPPARVWIYRRASGPARARRLNPAEIFFDKLRLHTGKVKEELRLRTDHMRSEIGRGFDKVRPEGLRRKKTPGKRHAEAAFALMPRKNQRKNPHG